MTRAGFRPAASADVDAAYEWYQEQRPGLGDEFVVAIDAAVASILAFPEAYPVVHRGVRRVLLERFPYGLYYRLTGQRAIIVACMHAARDAKVWRSRLDG
ncbi:MAG: type II toxin-antitoxin system RelE/ParE family toxin [Acidobacteria bacterium]|nr:type II toxin-antitoxin system RelE/ParE family toxin [Acidobacteriota bacterium]